MMNRVATKIPRAACVSFAVACVLALTAACGSGPKYPDQPDVHVDYPAYGPTSPEELVYFSTVVARVRLLSASYGVRIYKSDSGKIPAPVFVFRFRAIEYLKGSGDDELTVRVVAESFYNYTLDANTTQSAMKAQSRLAERDTRWDDREAVVFLRPSTILAESGVYEFADRGDWSPDLYSYDISSSRNRAWLPAVAPDSSSSPEPRYLAAAPGAQPDGVAAKPDSPSAASISLSEIKALVAANEDMVAKGRGVPGYEDCVEDRFEFDALYKWYPPEMSFNEIRVPSGQPAGHSLAGPYARDPDAYYDKWWFAGADSDLFASMITDDLDNDPATGYAWEYVAIRPIPEGEYKVFVNSLPSAWTPCDYNPEALLNRHETTIIATAPDGVVHEAFFDPVDMAGGAIGADAANGVLDPPDFTFMGASVSLDSIRWESQAVEMRLSPHTRLANHHADFIAEDGSVALRLDFDAATQTGAGASRALRWKVCAQPWSDGDLLMLRISESPADLTGATLDADCLAAEDEPAASGSTAVSHSLAAQGATTPEELIFLSSTVARVRLISAEAGVRRYPPEDGEAPAPVFAFRFSVIEYLKGDGDDELTVRVLAEDNIRAGDYYLIASSPPPTPDANAALRTARTKLAERDARWDNREAIVFLRPSRLASESGVYEFAWRHSDATPGLHDYAIASDYDNARFPNRAWLPGVAPTGNMAAEKGASIPSEPRYLTAAPDARSQFAIHAPSISLSEMKALVAAGEDMMTKGKDIPGYEDCVRAKYKFDALYKKYPPETSFMEIRIPSGQPAGHRLFPNPPIISTENHYTRWWFSGPDSDLFANRIINDPDNNPATGYAWEQVALRPMPEGEYNVFVNNQPSGWIPCGYNPQATKNRRDRTIIATAPDGVIHEAFFDPVDMAGGAIGADGSNGVLDPPDFTFNGASVSIDSIRWQSQAVEMRLSPHTRPANHHADFIAPDGSGALRLDFDDATQTGAGASRALRWKVCAQPWSDGDLLMLRISESPTNLTGAALDADCPATSAADRPPTVSRPCATRTFPHRSPACS